MSCPPRSTVIGARYALLSIVEPDPGGANDLNSNRVNAFRAGQDRTEKVVLGLPDFFETNVE